MRARQRRGRSNRLRSAEERAIARAAMAIHHARELQRAEDLERSEWSARWAEWTVNLPAAARRRMRLGARA